MMALSDAVSTALISGTFGVLLALIKVGSSLRRLTVENKRQHDDNRTSSQADMAALAAQLDMVHDDVKTSRVELRDDINRVHQRMNDHIRHHNTVVPVTEPEHTTSSTAAKPRRRKTA